MANVNSYGILPQLVATDREFDLALVETDLTERGDVQKPKKALWTSTFENGSSDWCEWLLREEWYVNKHFFLLKPRKDVRVLTIASREDGELIPRDEKGYIDFFALAAEGWDGLRVLANLTGFCFHADGSENLFGFWDVESTVWFNTDWVESVEEIELPEFTKRGLEIMRQEEERQREWAAEAEEDDDDEAFAS